MIWEEYLPMSLSIDVEWELFWHLNPKKLAPFIEAHKKKLKEIDSLIHSWVGTYGISALTTAISKCFSRHSTAEYIKDSIMANALMSDSDIEREVEKFYAEQRARRANWKRQKSKKERSDNVEAS